MRNVYLFSWLLLLMAVAVAPVSGKSFTPAKNYKNHITLANGYRYLPGSYKPFLSTFQFFIPYFNWSYGEQFNITYSRDIWKHFGLEVGINRWVPQYEGGRVIGYFEPPPQPGRIKGHVEFRSKYQFVFLDLTYHLQIYKRHTADFNAGYCFARGNDIVYDTIYINPDPPFDGIGVVHDEINDYKGTRIGVKYNYSIYKDRLRIGANFNSTRLEGVARKMMFYGLQVTYNFL